MKSAQPLPRGLYRKKNEVDNTGNRDNARAGTYVEYIRQIKTKHTKNQTPQASGQHHASKRSSMAFRQVRWDGEQRKNQD